MGIFSEALKLCHFHIPGIDSMKSTFSGVLISIIFPCLALAGDVESVWSGENLSIVKERGDLFSVTDNYKITMSEQTAEDLRYVLETYVRERDVASTLRSKLHHPLGRILIDMVAYNVESFKRELNTEGAIGKHGIVIKIWVPKAGMLMTCHPPDVFGIQEKISDAYWAVINPWSWKITARA